VVGYLRFQADCAVWPANPGKKSALASLRAAAH
jgi:hypothetical protein